MAIETVALSDPPYARVAGVSLGLTLYLDDAVGWAREHAAAALTAYLRRLGPSRPLGWFTTSLLEAWRPLDPGQYSSLIEGVSNWTAGRPRHLFWVSVADNPHAALAGFTYREVDSPDGARASTLEVRFGQDSEPGELLEYAAEVAANWPIWCGVGGYQVAWNPMTKSTAFWWAYRWCLRYIGLDVQDAPAAAWRVATGVPGTNWLTLLGERFARVRELDLDAIRARAWTQPVEVRSYPRAMLVRAGPAPTLGDVNRLEYATAYAEVARALAPAFVKESPRFAGGFFEEGVTGAWMRRFVEPGAWARR